MQPNPYPNESQPNPYPNDPAYPQPGPYPNDPTYPQPNTYPHNPPYEQPTERYPQESPYQQDRQKIQPPYPYQDPSYQQAPRNQRQSHTTKYIVAKVIDYITWAILVLEAIFLLRFFLKLLGADPNNQFAQFLYIFIILPASFFIHLRGLCKGGSSAPTWFMSLNGQR